MSFPLYHKYPGQSEAQPASFSIYMESGKFGCDWDGELDGCPGDVFYGSTRRYEISNLLTEEQVDAIIYDPKIEKLVAKIVADQSREFDGNNLHLVIGEKGRKAERKLEKRLRKLTAGAESDEVYEYEVADYIGSGALADCWPDGKDLYDAKRDLMEDAAKNNCALSGDTEEALLDFAERRISECSFQHLLALAENGRLTRDMITDAQPVTFGEARKLFRAGVK